MGWDATDKQTNHHLHLWLTVNLLTMTFPLKVRISLMYASTCEYLRRAERLDEEKIYIIMLSSAELGPAS